MKPQTSGMSVVQSFAMALWSATVARASDRPTWMDYFKQHYKEFRGYK